jgi:RNA polymerase sigma-70 factor (ECF subfamily)
VPFCQPLPFVGAGFVLEPMSDPLRESVTQLLIDWSRGSRTALDKLVPLVYDELRRIAQRSLRRERSDHTIQATAVVHEAYLKLIDQRHVRWQDRAHFFAVAAQVIRRILVDHARRRHAAKRGGNGKPVSLTDVALAAEAPAVDLVALDDLLQRLAARDPRQSQIVELRFFGGLTIEETADVLRLSPATIKGEWRLARAWLYNELQGGQTS